MKNSNPKISRIEIFTFRAASRGLCEEAGGGEREAGHRGGAGEEGGEEEEERELLMRATNHCIRQHTSAYVSIRQHTSAEEAAVPDVRLLLLLYRPYECLFRYI